MAEDKGKMTVEEAGRKGGRKTSETHDREFYEEIGHKGGVKGGEKGGHQTQAEARKYKEMKEGKEEEE